MSTKEDIANRAAAMPGPAPEGDGSVVAMIDIAASMSLGSALTLINLLPGGLSQEDAQAILFKRTLAIRNPSLQPEAAEQELGFCEFLIGKGADPMMPSPKADRWGSESSLIGALPKAGLWRYAQKLLERAGPGGEARALAVITAEHAAMNKSLHERFGMGGPEGIAFAARLGMNMSETVGRAPWAAMSQDALDLRAFAAAGADLSAVDSQGRTLAEIFALRPPGRARQGLVQAIVELTQGGDQENVVKMMGTMAREGSFKEMAALAASGSLDPATAKDQDGRTMLGIALSNANWTMARDLMKAGAKPTEPCGADGIPAGARALTGIASEKASKARANAEAGCLETVFSKMDFSWRDKDGLPALEAMSAADKMARPGGQVYWNMAAIEAWAKAEPESSGVPMWERAMSLKVQDAMVATVAGWRTRESSTSSAGLGLLEWAVSRTRSYWQEGRSNMTMLLRARGESARKNSCEKDEDLAMFKPEHWGKAATALWALADKAHEAVAAGKPDWEARRAAEHACDEFCLALRHWVVGARLRGKTPFSASDMQEWAFGRWSADNPASGTLAGKIIAAGIHAPREAMMAGAIMDLAAKRTPSAAEAAEDAWKKMKVADPSRELPESHEMYGAHWEPIPELAQTQLWKAVEERRHKIEVPHISKARRL